MADEAYRCRSIGASRAALVLARAVIEASAKDHDVLTGSLAGKIEKLAERGLIRQSMKESAHEIREHGNGIAHGDLGVQVDPEDADLVLELMHDVLNELYVAPARAARSRAARAAKKANGSTA